MPADEGLVTVFLRLTQGGFRLEEGALTMRNRMASGMQRKPSR